MDAPRSTPAHHALPMRLLSTLALPAFVLALVPLADTPVYQPAEGSKVETTWKIDLGVELGDLSATVNGEAVDPEQMGIPPDLSAKGVVEMRWLDHFVSMDGSRTLELLRTVRTMHAEGETSVGPSGESDDDDEIVGKPMRFRWNAEDETYEREWVEAEGKDKDLQHMAVDADLRGLLPEGEVELGQTWEARGTAVLRLLVPLFAVETITEGEEDEDIPPELLEKLSAFGEDVVVRCTWRGAHDEGGRTLGRIDLALDLDQSLDVDPSSFGQEMEGMEVDPVTFAVQASLAGFLDWDMSAHRMSAVELTGSGTISLDVSMSHPQGFDMEGSAEASFDLGVHGSALEE